jgi:hypothetical protein
MRFSRVDSIAAIGGPFLLLLALSSCVSDDLTCVGIPKPGIVLTVLDAATNADLGQLAMVTVTTLAPGGQALTGPVEQVAKLHDPCRDL